MKKKFLRSSKVVRAFKVKDVIIPDGDIKVFRLKPDSSGTKGIINENTWKTLANLATSLWRARKRILGDKGDVPTDLKKILRPIDSAVDSLEKLGIRFVDHSGELYDPGMALKVISCQPRANISRPTIAETLKPSVFHLDKLIQQGDVIVNEPIK